MIIKNYFGKNRNVTPGELSLQDFLALQGTLIILSSFVPNFWAAASENHHLLHHLCLTFFVTILSFKGEKVEKLFQQSITFTYAYPLSITLWMNVTTSGTYCVIRVKQSTGRIWKKYIVTYFNQYFWQHPKVWPFHLP